MTEKRFLHKPVLLKLLRRGEDFIFEGGDKTEWRIIAIGEHTSVITDGNILDSAENTRMVRKLKSY